ncbi:phage portal protein [Mobilitalea sibirica]|uniref:Phage portal protein n=2 Tax=Mobilitalea sibirica TaxID=1462919 RepID=A0A8J7H3H5_9FIRM|nr:phage portal protein [Mobilitalea sibirica]MBH1941642.1 phage portal protein [Mobilitalea sibirica]
MMKGYIPVFTQFGDEIYASDIVQIAIRCIATEISKLNPQHIRTENDTGLQSVVNDSIHRLLKFGPNPLMSTSDFLEKIVYLREINKNAYIYPSYVKIPLGEGTYRREYTGLYPLNPLEVEYLEDTSGKLFIKFYFVNGYDYTLPYEDIIHWRKDFTANDFVGGDAQGKSDNKALIKLLETDDTAIQGIGKGIKSTMVIRGIQKINTLLDDEEQKKEREAFEQKINESQSGILAIDLKGDFTPIKIDPKFIDKDTIEFIAKRILANYGVSLAIFNGEFTEEEYQAFYEKTIEPQIISLGRVFSKVLFTKRELEVGNEIIFYNQGLMFMNTTNKINAADILTRLGTLTDNQVLAIFGYPPFEGGNVRKQSLNYINRDIADQYQLSKNKGKEKQNE